MAKTVGGGGNDSPQQTGFGGGGSFGGGGGGGTGNYGGRGGSGTGAYPKSTTSRIAKSLDPFVLTSEQEEFQRVLRASGLLSDDGIYLL